MHEQVNLTIRRDRQLGGDDIVFGILIVRSIEAKKIRVGFADLVGVQWAESSVGSGVAEIECELSRLHLNWHRIGRGRSEVDTGPRLCPKHTQSQRLHAYEQEGGDHQSRSATGEALNLVARPGAGALPDAKC